MKKLLTKIIFAVAGFAGVAVAQQDPQLTQFMYNKLIYNPGYAGTQGAVCGVLQYRKQWMGFGEEPTTMVVAANMRLSTLPVGLGISVISDEIGPMKTTFAKIAGSYNILKVGGGTLGLGLDVGILQKRISSTWIVPEPLKEDLHIPGIGGYVPGYGDAFNNPDLNKTSIDLGLGAFWQIPGKAYAGLSITHLPAQEMQGSGDITYQVTRHYYMMAGYTFQPTKWSKITPNVLYKSDMASSSLDANLTFLWSDMIWIGGTYRVNDAPAILAGYTGEFGNGNAYRYKIGYSYDFTTTKLKTYAKGSHEFILGVCYTPTVKKPTRYQNDRFLE